MADIMVLRTTDMEAARDFLTRLGLTFAEERHGNGPRHYACEQNGVVFEIYPAKKNTAVQFMVDQTPPSE